MAEQNTQNVMRQIYLNKVVMNIGVGKSGSAIEAAKKALDQISGRKSCARDAKKSYRDFGVRKGEPIGAAVTVRGEEAGALLQRLLQARGDTIQAKSFDDFGNFSFGISEHIDIPGVKYDPQIGILGMDVSVSLQRPGFGIRQRSKHKARVGKAHRISAQEARDFAADRFGVSIE